MCLIVPSPLVLLLLPSPSRNSILIILCAYELTLIRISTNLAKLNTAALELQTWSNTPIGQEYDIWVSYLKLCIVFLKAKSLALENFSEIKQRTILKSRNGDLRDDVIQSLKTLWDALGPHQIHMLDDAVGPFLELVIVSLCL